MLVKPRRPSGFGEYSPSEQIEFNRLLDIIRRTYEKYGFSPLDTPDIELSEILLAGGGGETSKQVYRFKRSGSGTDLTLRYDLTVPLARYVAEHENDLTFPFRRYQIGKVHRAERAQAGRFREFYQCDIDVVGSNSPIVDAEFPAIINEIFEAFGFGEFVIHINNRLILNGFFEDLGLADRAPDVLRTIDKIEKITPDEFVQSLAGLGLEYDQIEKIIELTKIEGSNRETIDKLKALEIHSESFRQGVDKLEALVQALRTMNVPEKRFQINLKIARGLDYYTGTVYETTLQDYPEVGSVCSGGRYDNLTKHYTRSNLPGVGISIGLSRLFYKLKEVGVIETKSVSPAQVIVVPISEDQISDAVATSAEFRDLGLSTLLYSEQESVGKKLNYANKTGFKWVVIIGEDEVLAGKISLKNMETGQTQSKSVRQAADLIKTKKDHQ